MTDPLRSIHLHGALGERFGQEFNLAVETPREAVRALSVQLPGFRQAIAKGHWKIIRGEFDELGIEEIEMHLGKAPLHIVPVLEGSGFAENAGKIVAGLALAAGAAFFAPAIPLIGAIVANAGVGIGITLALSGATALLSPKPAAANGRGGVDERASFVFNGAENVAGQGGCVPLVFGEFLVGSVVVSAGLSTEQI